jgi:hypothetical protein
VPELLAVNDGDASVLTLAGEQLIGARQNWTPNLPVRIRSTRPQSR